MKSKQEKKDDAVSLKNNSMSPAGKSPSPIKSKKEAPDQFAEDRSTRLRMTEQPLKESAKKKK